MEAEKNLFESKEESDRVVQLEPDFVKQVEDNLQSKEVCEEKEGKHFEKVEDGGEDYSPKEPEEYFEHIFNKTKDEAQQLMDTEANLDSQSHMSLDSGNSPSKRSQVTREEVKAKMPTLDWIDSPLAPFADFYIDYKESRNEPPSGEEGDELLQQVSMLGCENLEELFKIIEDHAEECPTLEEWTCKFGENFNIIKFEGMITEIRLIIKILLSRYQCAVMSEKNHAPHENTTANDVQLNSHPEESEKEAGQHEKSRGEEEAPSEKGDICDAPLNSTHIESVNSEADPKDPEDVEAEAPEDLFASVMKVVADVFNTKPTGDSLASLTPGVKISSKKAKLLRELVKAPLLQLLHSRSPQKKSSPPENTTEQECTPEERVVEDISSDEMVITEEILSDELEDGELPPSPRTLPPPDTELKSCESLESPQQKLKERKITESASLVRVNKLATNISSSDEEVAKRRDRNIERRKSKKKNRKTRRTKTCSSDSSSEEEEVGWIYRSKYRNRRAESSESSEEEQENERDKGLSGGVITESKAEENKDSNTPEEQQAVEGGLWESQPSSSTSIAESSKGALPLPETVLATETEASELDNITLPVETGANGLSYSSPQKSELASDVENEGEKTQRSFSPRFESTCPKCMLIFETAGLLRRHQRQGCRTDSDKKDTPTPTTLEVESHILEKPATQESLTLSRYVQEIGNETSDIHPEEIDQSGKRALAVGTRAEEKDPDAKAEEALKTFEKRDPSGIGCKKFFQGYLKLLPICTFRIRGCKRLVHCRFTHIIPEHLNMPNYCEPFLQGKCFGGGLKKHNCYKHHMSRNDLNKMFYERLYRLSKICEFCATASKLVSKEVSAIPFGGESVNMLGESKVTHFVNAKTNCANGKDIQTQKSQKEEETKVIKLVEDAGESKLKVRERTAFDEDNVVQERVALDREALNLVEKAKSVRVHEGDESTSQFDLFIVQLRDLLYLQPGRMITMEDFIQVMKLSKKKPSDFGFNGHIELLSATGLIILHHSKAIKLLAQANKIALESFKANSTKLLLANSPLTLERFGRLYCDQFALQSHRKLCEETLEHILKKAPIVKRVLSTGIKLLSLAGQSSPRSVTGQSTNVKNPPTKCLYFHQKGRCHFGHKCLNIH